MNLIEYIAKRKKEDSLNEFDYQSKAENTRICVNYIFEYFNNYLGDDSVNDEKTILQVEKLEKYRKQLDEYELDTQEWLVNIFDEYGKKMNIIISNFLKKQEFFMLYNSDSEFRGLSYECYSRLSAKHPFIKEHTEMIFHVIKEQHKIKSLERMYTVKFRIIDLIDDWIEDTWNKYNVNIVAFAEDWIDKFYDSTNLWPATHKKKSNNQWIKYEYDYRQESNLFNLNELYRKMPKIIGMNI
ncbi:hypothetical protein [Paenibacillus sp.]|uniref:hypothetical protein n=1 Tax=Paenibacillus sp. TaxID=58172 RepID=UPI0028226400|nr:hypothetical protein [Paenibacillus sp.]MDR0269588.1 hypothetical protein [Paenibacillus sp.]